MTTFKTTINLSDSVRTTMIALLAQQLVDTLDLQSQAKQAHWNVKGPHFLELHELYDELAKELTDFVDTIAERITALGGTALGTVRASAGKSSLPELPVSMGGGVQSVQLLAERYSKLAASSRAAIDLADKSGDKCTADLFTGVCRALDKSLWFLEAHLQAN